MHASALSCSYAPPLLIVSLLAHGVGYLSTSTSVRHAGVAYHGAVRLDGAVEVRYGADGPVREEYTLFDFEAGDSPVGARAGGGGGNPKTQSSLLFCSVFTAVYIACLSAFRCASTACAVF
eukprot:SAG22_NODE_136_length_18095_cov_19.897255_24_plen_121_part_00